MRSNMKFVSLIRTCLCRPSSIMNFLQDAATRHARNLGIGRDELTAASKAIWMIVRLKYKLYRPLKADEFVTVKTWYRAPKGAYALRDFQMYVGQECVGEALSTWVIADMETHALLKAEDILKGMDTPNCAISEETLGKIRMPKEMQEAGQRTIGYSETDINGHANNTRYADYACDAVHFENFAGRYLKEFQITYSSECLAGQTVYMLSEKEENVFYVRGVDKEGKSHFDIRMEVAEI